MSEAKNKANSLLTRARSLYKREGLIGFVRLFGRRLAAMPSLFFYYRVYYLFEEALENIDSLSEADFMPVVDGLTVKIVSSSAEANVIL